MDIYKKKILLFQYYSNLKDERQKEDFRLSSIYHSGIDCKYGIGYIEEVNDRVKLIIKILRKEAL